MTIQVRSPCTGPLCPAPLLKPFVDSNGLLGVYSDGPDGGLCDLRLLHPDSTVPSTIPSTPPLILIGTFGADPQLGQQLSVSGSLWAYGSPIQVGTFTMTATTFIPTPEPATLALLDSVLVAIAGLAEATFLA